MRRMFIKQIHSIKKKKKKEAKRKQKKQKQNKNKQMETFIRGTFTVKPTLSKTLCFLPLLICFCFFVCLNIVQVIFYYGFFFFFNFDRNLNFKNYKDKLQRTKIAIPS